MVLFVYQTIRPKLYNNNIIIIYFRYSYMNDTLFKSFVATRNFTLLGLYMSNNEVNCKVKFLLVHLGGQLPLQAL